MLVLPPSVSPSLVADVVDFFQENLEGWGFHGVAVADAVVMVVVLVALCDTPAVGVDAVAVDIDAAAVVVAAVVVGFCAAGGFMAFGASFGFVPPKLQEQDARSVGTESAVKSERPRPADAVESQIETQEALPRFFRRRTFARRFGRGHGS